MLSINQIEILLKAIEHYGESTQVLKTIEELSELIRAIAINSNGEDGEGYENLIDELADSLIMIEQVKLILECKDEVDERIEFKLDRLEKRINDELKRSKSTHIWVKS